MHTAGRDISMKGYLIEPMTIDIKGLQFNESLYVAPIEDAMLIGLDFLSKYHVEIDMKQGLFGVQGQKIPFIEGKGNSVHDVHVTEVRMVRRTVIPARSALRIHCHTDHPLKPACYLVEPDLKTVLAPRVCIVGAGEPVMSFVNLSDSKITLFKNQKVGKVYEVDEIHPSGESDHTDILQTTQAKHTTGNGRLPEHLEDMYESSCMKLNQKEQYDLKNLLIEFADVFSVHEFDLGNFTAIEHTIDTGDAAPVKQKFRRTPTSFEVEEEKHLEKMLKADVIEPSMS